MRGGGDAALRLLHSAPSFLSTPRAHGPSLGAPSTCFPVCRGERKRHATRSDSHFFFRTRCPLFFPTLPGFSPTFRVLRPFFFSIPAFWKRPFSGDVCVCVCLELRVLGARFFLRSPRPPPPPFYRARRRNATQRFFSNFFSEVGRETRFPKPQPPASPRARCAAARGRGGATRSAWGSGARLFFMVLYSHCYALFFFAPCPQPTLLQTKKESKLNIWHAKK